MKNFEKQPNETLDYFFDFRNWLTSKTDTPAAVDPYVLLLETGITKVSDNMNTPGVVQLFLAAGDSGKSYKVTCRMTTTGGRVKEADFRIKVREV
jgi:hypothetical protein